MKRFFITVIAVAVTTVCSAQFTEGTKYANLSMSGLNLSYSGAEKCRLDISAMGGYFLMDKLSVNGLLEYDTNGDSPAFFSLGVQGRYYITQNGIYLGVGCKYRHADSSYDDFLPGIEIGYAFYLNRYVTIEPAIYYDQSLKNHSDYSKVGLKIGAGFYF